MKNFFNQIISSVYNPNFYKDLESKDSSFTILYLLKLMGLLSLLTSIAIVFVIYQFQSNLFANAKVNNFKELANKYIETYFADDLIISFKDFNLSTNKTEPVIFPVPKDWFDFAMLEEQEVPDNVLVIAPGEVASSVSLDKYNTIALLSSTSAAYYDSNQNDVKVSNYRDLDDEITPITDNKADLVVTKEIAQNKISEVINYLWYLVPVLYLVLFVVVAALMFLFTVISEFVYALFSGLVAFLVSRLTKTGGKYGLWYLKAIHADTLYILLTATIGWFVPLSTIPFLALASIILILVLNKNFIK